MSYKNITRLDHHAVLTDKMLLKIQRNDYTEKLPILPIYQQVICLTRLKLIDLKAVQTTKMFDNSTYMRTVTNKIGKIILKNK